MIRAILLSAALGLAGCANVSLPLDFLEEKAEATPPAPEPDEPTYRWWLSDDGRIEFEEDPYSRRQVRRADYDTYITLLARDVALVLEPAIGAPIAVSNTLNAALVRRFAGQLPLKEALAASKVFLMRAQVTSGGSAAQDVMVVDWRLRSDSGADVGVVYAARRLSGEATPDKPWSAMTEDDAEHIALQSAAQLLEAEEVRAAVENARNVAALERAPNPKPRPKR